MCEGSRALVLFITFSGDSDNINLVAHYSTGREELFAEDDGLNSNLEPVREKWNTHILTTTKQQLVLLVFAVHLLYSAEGFKLLRLQQ